MSSSAWAGEDLRAEVLRRLAAAAGTHGEAGAISADDLLREDLGLDSLAALLLVLELEEHLGIDIEDDELASLDTVGSLLELMDAKCQAAGAGPP